MYPECLEKICTRIIHSRLDVKTSIILHLQSVLPPKGVQSEMIIGQRTNGYR